MDWPDWLFAGTLLLGLWELTVVLDAGPRRPRSRRDGAGVSAGDVRERRSAVADLPYVALAIGFLVAMLGYAVACEKL
jgi:hypothetical protein